MKKRGNKEKTKGLLLTLVPVCFSTRVVVVDSKQQLGVSVPLTEPQPAIIWKSCCQRLMSTVARGAYLRHLFSLLGTSPTIRAAAQSAAILPPSLPPNLQPSHRPPVWNTFCQTQLGCGEKRKKYIEVRFSNKCVAQDLF